MKIFFLAALLSLIAAAPGHANSEAEFQKLFKSSPVLREADAYLNQTWKRVSANIPKRYKKDLLGMQREWVKNGRDESAEEYLQEGYSRACAYAIATVRWAKNLGVYEYNFNLSQEDQDNGRVRADDFYWNEDEDIPIECRK